MKEKRVSPDGALQQGIYTPRPFLSILFRLDFPGGALRE